LLIAVGSKIFIVDDYVKYIFKHLKMTLDCLPEAPAQMYETRADVIPFLSTVCGEYYIDIFVKYLKSS